MTRTIFAACAFGLALLGTGVLADAAEVKVFSPAALRIIMSGLIPAFEKSSANKVTITYGAAGALADRIRNGEPADVAIVTRPQLEALVKQGKIVPSSQVNVAKVGIGVAVNRGAPKPDISSVEAFKRSMLKAKSIAYINPTKGGPAGIYLVGMFERLGIASEIKSKTELTSGPPQDAVIKGDAEIVITQISEIIAEPRVDFVGPLPAEIQNFTQFAAGRGTGSNAADAADALIKFLASPAAAAALKTKGLDPG